MSLDAWLEAAAAVREDAGLTRRLRSRGPRAGAAIDLAGNDYLGLSRDPRVVEAAVEATRTWGAGATGSRLVTGTTRLHDTLETELAALCLQESALVFSSGYLANLGAVTALTDAETLLVSDEHVHASLVDAARLSRARVQVTPHGDVDAVRRALRGRTEPRAVVVVESVFSVLGDAAPLSSLADACAELDAVLLVDEAHGLGVTGEGRGSVASAGLAGRDHVVVTATLSKALAGQGGAVLGSARLRHHLVNHARSFIFDTGLAPGAAGAALAALRVVGSEPGRVARVAEVARRLASACGVPPAAGAVLSVPMPSPQQAVLSADACAREDVRVGVFRPPSVPDGTSRIRLTASAALDDEKLARASAVIAQAVEEAAWTCPR